MNNDPEYMMRRWEALCEAAQECRACALHKQATQKVVGDPGVWDGTRAILFIGEAPGEDEDREGVPFVGRSGQKLRDHIKSIGIQDGSYAIMNTVQCRPPNNRDPEPMEINACSKFFVEKIKMWDPKVIVPLGKPACKTAFGVNVFSIVPNACQERQTSIKCGSQKVELPAFPLPHPRWGIHNPDSYKLMWDKLRVWLSKKGVQLT